MIDRIIETVAGTILTVTITIGIYILYLWFTASVRNVCKSKKKTKVRRMPYYGEFVGE